MYLLSKQLATIIRRLRQGATDYDLMQSMRVPAHATLVSSRLVDSKREVFDPSTRTSPDSHSMVGNVYQLSRKNSQVGKDDEADYLKPSLQSHSSSASLDDAAGVASRPYDDHILAGTFIQFDCLAVDSTVVLKPASGANESLRHAMLDDNSLLSQDWQGFQTDQMRCDTIDDEGDDEYLT